MGFPFLYAYPEQHRLCDREILPLTWNIRFQ